MFVHYFSEEALGRHARYDLIKNRSDHPGLNSCEPHPGFRGRLFSLVFSHLCMIAICSQLSKCFVESFVSHFRLLSIGKICAHAVTIKAPWLPLIA